MRSLIVERKNKGRVFTVTITGAGGDVLTSLSNALRLIAEEHKLQVFNRADPFGTAAKKKLPTPKQEEMPT